MGSAGGARLAGALVALGLAGGAPAAAAVDPLAGPAAERPEEAAPEGVELAALEPAVVLQGLQLAREAEAGLRRLGPNGRAGLAWLAAFVALVAGSAARLELEAWRRRRACGERLPEREV